MDREQQRQFFKEKNERRRVTKHKSRTTLYAREAQEERRKLHGAFGRADVITYNKLAEGTTAVPRDFGEFVLTGKEKAQ